LTAEGFSSGLPKSMEAKIRDIQLKGSARKVLEMSNIAESKYLDVEGMW